MISSQDYGITIIIPPGAIPQGTEILVQVHCCCGGPFVLPKGYRLCSPVYIISPPFHVLQDIELQMVHHAYLSDPEDCSQMMFVTDAPSLETLDQELQPCRVPPEADTGWSLLSAWCCGENLTQTLLQEGNSCQDFHR